MSILIPHEIDWGNPTLPHLDLEKGKENINLNAWTWFQTSSFAKCTTVRKVDNCLVKRKSASWFLYSFRSWYTSRLQKKSYKPSRLFRSGHLLLLICTLNWHGNKALISASDTTNTYTYIYNYVFVCSKMCHDTAFQNKTL